MNKVKSLSQQNLSLLLAIYIGIFLNLSVFYRRFDSLAHGLQGIKLISAVTEVIAIVLFTFFIMRLVSLGGRLFYRIVASLLVLISVAASYYMTFFNVVIGYGIVVSVMTTDTDLSKEVVGLHFVLWMVALSALPLLLIWKNSLRYTLIEQLKTPVIASNRCWSCWRWWRWSGCRCVCWTTSKACKKLANIDLPSYGGVVAHSYLPSNWLSALGLFAYTRYDESQDQSTLFDPGKHFTYVPPADIDDTYVVFIIGETTRWDHMGMLGYERDTTPRLSKEKNLVAFRGESCDTATKLSLRCMFVREDGTEDNPQRTLKEQNVFAVMKELGFSSELFAMQSEVWFYNNTRSGQLCVPRDDRVREAQRRQGGRRYAAGGRNEGVAGALSEG